MGDRSSDISAAAARHGLSQGAAEALFRALVSGGGGQAQFSHPELGGMGQWSNGMTQIGDMFNDALKARVGAFCADMAATARDATNDTPSRTVSNPASPWARPDSGQWWPASLGAPASSGGQNGMRYAFFPDRRRLALERDGQVTLYDTGDHRLNGFGQQQSGSSSLRFSGQDGPVALESLKAVDA